MKEALHPNCERICKAADGHIRGIVAEVTEIEDNALDQGCDVVGGEIRCITGPVPVQEDQPVRRVIMSCGAICDIPDIINSDNQQLAADIQTRIGEIVGEVFEVPND